MRTMSIIGSALLFRWASFALCILLLAASTVHPSLIPPSILSWNKGIADELKAVFNQTRLWDRDDLGRAASIVNFAQMRPLIHKLRSGKAITVLAIGDSIVKDFGGCYHRSMEHLRHTVHSASLAVDTCFDETTRYGWLSMMMHTINATWPHPDHILINMGIPAMNFYLFANDECIEQFLPSSADLLILEHLPYLEPHNSGDPRSTVAVSAEVLLHRLQLKFNNHSHFPATIILNMHRLLDYDAPTFDQVAGCLLSRGSTCSSDCPESFKQLPTPGSEDMEAEQDSNRIAAHYGMSSLSYAKVLRSIVGRLRSAKPGGGSSGGSPRFSECQVLSALYERDPIHPSHLGELLIADVLVNHLHNAESFHLAELFKGSHSGPQHRPQPLRMDTRMIPVMRCFGATGQPSSSPFTSSSIGAAEELVAIKAEGWVIVEQEKEKHKPGWVATQPGSVLWISLDTGFGSADIVQQRGVKVEIRFLSSYEHMGRASMSCVSGCQCQDEDVDGHQPVHRHSVPLTIGMTVTASLDCVIQVLVLPETGSGEHKVKILQVAVKTWFDTSQA